MSIALLCKGLVWEWYWYLLEAKLALGDELSELLSLEQLGGACNACKRETGCTLHCCSGCSSNASVGVREAYKLHAST
eukprot:1576469-Rhodomonas_salina.1